MKKAASKVICLTLLFNLFALVSVNAHEEHGAGGKRTFTKHFQETLFDITEKGSFSIEILLDEKEYKIGKDAVGIVLHDDHDSDVKGADFMITHKNLETGKDAPGTLTVTDRGNGLYIVSGLNLLSAGRWAPRIVVNGDGVIHMAPSLFADVLSERVPGG